MGGLGRTYDMADRNIQEQQEREGEQAVEGHAPFQYLPAREPAAGMHVAVAVEPYRQAAGDSTQEDRDAGLQRHAIDQ